MGLEIHIAAYEVKNGRLSYPERYLVQWLVAGECKGRYYTYLTRAETFAQGKRAKGFEVTLWDKIELRYLTF